METKLEHYQSARKVGPRGYLSRCHSQDRKIGSNRAPHQGKIQVLGKRRAGMPKLSQRCLALRCSSPWATLDTKFKRYHRNSIQNPKWKAHYVHHFPSYVTKCQPWNNLIDLIEFIPAQSSRVQSTMVVRVQPLSLGGRDVIKASYLGLSTLSPLLTFLEYLKILCPEYVTNLVSIFNLLYSEHS